jgi:hypothetical protein
MKLSNSMEQAVRTHLDRMRAESPTADESCWCPLCRADTMALALTSLPPRYATSRYGSVDLEAQTATAVHEGLVQARRQVERRPRHAEGDAVATGEPVWVVNFPLEEGFRVVETILRRHEDACDCWNCRCDIVAFALNRYPARYGVEHKGQTHLFEADRERMREELSSYLDVAVKVVTAVPRHDLRPARRAAV